MVYLVEQSHKMMVIHIYKMTLQWTLDLKLVLAAL